MIKTFLSKFAIKLSKLWLKFQPIDGVTNGFIKIQKVRKYCEK